jgi:hypothetical protein
MGIRERKEKKVKMEPFFPFLPCKEKRSVCDEKKFIFPSEL